MEDHQVVAEEQGDDEDLEEWAQEGLAEREEQDKGGEKVDFETVMLVLVALLVRVAWAVVVVAVATAFRSLTMYFAIPGYLNQLFAHSVMDHTALDCLVTLFASTFLIWISTAICTLFLAL